MNYYCEITGCFNIIGFEVIMDTSYQLSCRQNLQSTKLLIAQRPSQAGLLPNSFSPKRICGLGKRTKL